MKQFQVDAFTNRAFAGNPAAVIVTDGPLAEALMRDIAAENNLSETAYVHRDNEFWNIRWFTPTVEVDLCGHATLAAAWVLATEYGLLAESPDGVELRFASRSGELRVQVEHDSVTLDFPAQPVRSVPLPQAIANGLGVTEQQVQCFKADIPNGNYLVVMSEQAAVEALAPNMAQLEQITDGGIIATAKGVELDFVSRFFGPYYGIPEDPVTGSAHCSLVTYWAQVLGLNSMRARQVSPRGGDLYCQLDGDRVRMRGQAVTVKESEWRL
jgi:PhzF family phenazine biosynthesis protein